MIRECVVCGKGFKCSPSDKTVTCSKECSRINKPRTHKGKSNQWSEESRRRLSERGKTANLKKGTEAALKSPRAGRYETNINAKEWHIVSPEGKHFRFKNLCNWARNNCGLFGMDATEESAVRIEKGLQHAKAGELGKEYANTNMYKGWKVVTEPVTCKKKDTHSRTIETRSKRDIKQWYKAEEERKKKNGHRWHLVSSKGEHYKFRDLSQWARENSELFGFEKSEQNVGKIVSGICQAKAGKTILNYKGWEVIDAPKEYSPEEIIMLYKNGVSINMIHEMTGKSSCKIRKLLITKGLWKDELSEKVCALLKEGKTEEEIAKILNKSINVINSRSPYTRGIYGWDLSENALRIKKCRENKKREVSE